MAEQSSPGRQRVSFPIGVGPDQRFLTDARGEPFLLVADTAWSLLTTLPGDQATRYLDARKAQGFNTILTVLAFPSRGRGLSGEDSVFREQPFINNDITSPNEAYFKVVDQIVQEAANRDMLLVIGALWLADNSHQKGGLPSTSDWRTLGAWLGARYADKPNIVWMVGGDHDPNQTWGTDAGFDYTPFIDAAAEGLSSTDDRHLIAYHPALDSASLAQKSWLAFYTYQENRADSPPWSYVRTRSYHERNPTKPTLNIEPAYEPNDALTDTTTTPYHVRRNAWWSQLAGALGVTYGGPRETWAIGETTGTADEALAEVGREGARQTGVLHSVLDPLPWTTLAPDWSNEILTSGRGDYNTRNFAAAAAAPDGSLVIVYTPTARTLTVDLVMLPKAATCSWIDPTNGARTDSSPCSPRDRVRQFATPGQNADGADDWLLVIRTA